MKVKMKEYYNDRKHSLEKGAEYDLDASLARWLIENRKAEEVIIKAHYPDVSPQFEQAEEPPRPVDGEIKHQPVGNRKRGRGAK